MEAKSDLLSNARERVYKSVDGPLIWLWKRDSYGNKNLPG